MAKYTGRRIVPKHAGEWDIRKEYEELQIVLDADSGNSFIQMEAACVTLAARHEAKS